MCRDEERTDRAIARNAMGRKLEARGRVSWRGYHI